MIMMDQYFTLFSTKLIMVMSQNFLAHLQAPFNGPGRTFEPEKKVGLGLKPEPKKRIMSFAS